MAISYFVKHAVVLRENSAFVLQRKFDLSWQIEDEQTGQILTVPEHQLLNELNQGKLRFRVASTSHIKSNNKKSRDLLWRSLSDQERNEAKRKLAYVKVAELGSRSSSRLVTVIKEVCNRIQDKNKPSVPSLKRWVKKYVAAGRNVMSLVTRNHKKGNRLLKVDEEVQRIANFAIDTHYLSMKRPTLKKTLSKVAQLILDHNNTLPDSAPKLRVPSMVYLQRELKKRDLFEVHCARFGKDSAIRRFRSAVGGNFSVDFLNRVEIDHTPLDLMAIDDTTALPLGRPYLTLAIEVKTRCVMGFHISFEPPSYRSVAACLRHAIGYKNIQDTYPNIQNHWPCYGLFSALVMDNGTEFHSDHLEEAALRFGIHLQYCPRAFPWWKPYVERILGTINHGFTSDLAGKTFANLKERGNYNSEKEAVMTLAALKEAITTWIVDIYHVSPHRSLHQSPLSAWEEVCENHMIPVPDHLPDLEAALAHSESRMLTHKGIELFNLLYNDNHQCNHLRRRLGDRIRVNIRYRHEDLGTIFIEDPQSGEIFSVEVIPKYKEYATGLSVWQHQFLESHARKISRSKKYSFENLLKAEKRIRAICEEGFALKTELNRKIKARFKNSGSKKLDRHRLDPYNEQVEELTSQDHSIDLSFSHGSQDQMPTFVPRMRDQ